MVFKIMNRRRKGCYIVTPAGRYVGFGYRSPEDLDDIFSACAHLQLNPNQFAATDNPEPHELACIIGIPED